MSLIIREKKENIYKLLINRPKYYNALNLALLRDLELNLDFISNDSDAKAIIITGSGNKSFIAGADINEMSNMNRIEAENFSDYGQKLTMKIENFNIPIIAAINGYALGGGCEFAMSCHIRYASDNAMFSQPEVGLGLIAGFGGTQRLVQILGKSQALELLITGNSINAKEALDLGLINKISKQDDLISDVEKLCFRISQNAPLAIKATLKSVNHSVDNLFKDSLIEEKKQFSKLFDSYDAQEGMSSFKEKRKPTFKSK